MALGEGTHRLSDSRLIWHVPCTSFPTGNRKKRAAMEGQDNYWSTYRASASALHADGTSPLKTVAALAEIEQAIRDAFPAAFAVTARADVSDVLVQFGSGQK